jgi:myo-inositol-1(or 4)-monophosphatase
VAICTMAIGPFTQNELDEIYAFAVDLGRKAGKLLMERVDQRISDANGHSNSFEVILGEGSDGHGGMG